jgi:membrane protein DedA with SNARE-associated domain
VWAYFGTILSDAGWFLLAGTARSYIERSTTRKQRYERVLAWLDRRFGARPERALLFIKFIYGTRIATITYLAIRRTPFRVFATLNAVGTVIWLSVVVTIGWLAGKGLAFLGPQLSRLEVLLPLLLVLALVIRGTVKWLTQRTIQK